MKKNPYAFLLTQHHLLKRSPFLHRIAVYLCCESGDHVCVFVSRFSILVYLSVFMPVAHFLNSCSFMTGLDIW